MKRQQLMKLLHEANFQFMEGGRHTKVFKDDKLVTEVPRHKEIGDILARKILRDAGIKI